MNRPPVNIWNNIERCWVFRLDIVYEGQTIAGLHDTEWVDAVKEIDVLCRKLQQYKNELSLIYGNGKIKSNSIIYTHIYLLHDLNCSLYKIGRSIDPVFREKTIQSEQPNIVNIFTSPKTLKVKEKELHKIFQRKRVRGEWFNLEPQDILFIKLYNYGT